MRHLLEIAKIVTKKKVRKIEIFDDATLRHKNSKFNEFYEALMSSKFKNDRDAASSLYGTSPSDDKYRQLKSRFRKRLLNTLFFLDINLPATSNYDRAYYTCNKEWTLVKILASNGAHETAAAQARQILTIALKFKFADVIVNCSRILRESAATEGDVKGMEMYQEYLDTYLPVLNAEMASEELHQKVLLHYLHSNLTAEEWNSQIDDWCNTLVALSEQYESPIIMFNMFMVWAYRYELEKDFEALLEVCERAEEYVTKFPEYFRNDLLANFHIKKIAARLHMGDWKNGRTAAEKSQPAFLEGSELWFSFMEYYFLLAMHTGNYLNALAILNTATNHPKFRKMETADREKWNLFEVYLYMASEQQGDINPALPAQKRTQRINKFLEQPVNYSRDLYPLAYQALVAQVMCLIQRKRYHEISDRLEKLSAISNRYFKKEEHQRMQQFLKLLQAFEKSGYQADGGAQIEKHLGRLQETRFFYRGLLSELEIIPFEKLWEFTAQQAVV
jgi:hypothetical protein